MDQRNAIRDFYGADPLRGEDARLFLLSTDKGVSLEGLVCAEGANTNNWQVEMRLEDIARSTPPSPAIANSLARCISEERWATKGAAACCFGGFAGVPGLEAPLVEIFERSGDFDAERMAIEALGRLGADGWWHEIERYSRSGNWRTGELTERERIYHYAFDKLAPYTLQAAVRLCGRTRKDGRRSDMHDYLTSYFDLFESTLANRFPDASHLVGSLSRELKPASVDPLVKSWARRTGQEWRSLVLSLLRDMRAVRSARFLLEVATDPTLDISLRISASIALGELRDVQVADRVAQHIRSGKRDTDSLHWAYSALRMVPIDWSGCERFEDELLAGGDSEPALQLRYSLALAGDMRVRDALIDGLDSREWFTRAAAALSLDRLLGNAARPYLDGRNEEAASEDERCALYAALIHAGDATQASSLHEGLTAFETLTSLRGIWRIAIISAFARAPAFDQRALDLWWAASGLRLAGRMSFEIEGRNTGDPAPIVVLNIPSSQTPEETPFTKDANMLTLLAASQVASIANNAVSIIDKLYTNFIKSKTGDESAAGTVSPRSKIENDQSRGALLSLSHGQIVQSIDYKDLADRLDEQDLAFIRAKEKALNNHYAVWLGVYPEVSLMLDPIGKQRVKIQLQQIERDMGNELTGILNFLENRIGLQLDDHYNHIREIAKM